MIKYAAIFGLSLVFVSSFAFPGAQAQQFLNNTRQLTLTMTPESPRPGDTVRFQVSSYNIDLDRSDIVWRAQNSIIVEGAGVKEATVKAGATGTITRIRVTARDAEGNSATAEAVIRPVEIELIWSTDSYVAPLYRGRALPGANSKIRVYALARFPRGSALVPEKEIIYTWSHNNATLSALSGRGKSHIEIVGPSLYDRDSISVVAETVDRAWTGTASINIPMSDTVLELYENHPLYGILYHRAIIGEVHTNEQEQKLTAVPYFANIRTPSDSALFYDWSVNDVRAESGKEDPSTLIITTKNYTGPAMISLALTSATDIVMRAIGSWHMEFDNSTGVFFGENVFGQ